MPPRKPPPPSNEDSPHRLLEVEVVEAAGLLGMGGGGLSNPFVEISLVDLAGRPIQNEGIRNTSVVKGTVKPVWNYKTTFGKHYDLNSSSGGMF
ncbi:unnamed protein product, partial [Choristocarpus tenellus]